VVGREELDDEYDRCILSLNNGRQPGRPSSKHRESQVQNRKSHRCSKCSEVGHMRRTYRNPYPNFDASYEGDILCRLKICWMVRMLLAQVRHVVVQYNLVHTHTHNLQVDWLHTC